jgi:hypothetical protein
MGGYVLSADMSTHNEKVNVCFTQLEKKHFLSFLVAILGFQCIGSLLLIEGGELF